MRLREAAALRDGGEGPAGAVGGGDAGRALGVRPHRRRHLQQRLHYGAGRHHCLRTAQRTRCACANWIEMITAA